MGAGDGEHPVDGEREEASSRTATAAVSRVLIFLLGTRVLASRSAPGSRIVEIDSWTRVPTAPPHVLGIANAGGTVLAVTDVRPTLGLPTPPLPRPLRAVVVGGEELRAAVAIEGVLGLESCAPGLAREPDGELPEGLGRYALGVLDLPPWRPLLIDLPAIVEALRLRRNGVAGPAGFDPRLRFDTPAGADSPAGSGFAGPDSQADPGSPADRGPQIQ